MKPKLRTLFTCCAAGALAVSLAACEPEDARKTASAQSALADGGYEPGWSMMDLAGVDPAFYSDDYGALPQALPMKSSYAGDYGEAAGYGYAPAYDYAPDYPDSHYQPLDESYYYDEGPYQDGYLQDGYYEDGYHDDAYYDGSYYGGGGYDLGSDSSDFALLALAVALAGMLGDAPPDYGFAYDGVSPWAWQTGDRYFRYAEPIRGGYRYYYYEPDAHRPFLVSDPYYSYGYRGDRLAVIYDSAGRRVDARRAERQLRAAKTYYARAERLHRAANRDRFGVSAPLWERHRDRISRDRNNWETVRAERPGWQRWEARNAPRLYRQWSDEALVRRDAERSVATWQRADYRTPAPTLYTREARTEQVRNLANLRRNRSEELAERRRARAEQQIERQREVRRIAERTEKAEQRRERASQIAERREATVERRQQIGQRDRSEVASDMARARRVAIRQEARETREQASARREGNVPSARLAEQRREQRQAAAAERREEQRAEAQRRKERAAASAGVERTRKLAAAQEARRQDASRARAADRQREAAERRETQQRQQQARREAQQQDQQARREQVQAEASRQRAQAAAADRRAQREQVRQVAETRKAQQAEARQARARQAQAQQQAQREARQAQLAQARVAREPAPQAAQARQEARQQARQERQDERKERREQRQNRN
jgi:hypothetical protein